MVKCQKKPYYLLVADGMGGAAAGEIASKIAAFSVSQFLDEIIEEKIEPSKLIEAVNYANIQIVGEMTHIESLQGMGTTLTLASMTENSIAIAHVGDSGAFLYSNKEMYKITKDHTYVQKLIDSGFLEKSKADRYPLRNIITRVVGMEDLTVDTYEVSWKADDILLLCTDGLTSYSSEKEIFDILDEKSSLEEKANRFIELSLEKGGWDNISVVIAQNSEKLEDSL